MAGLAARTAALFAIPIALGAWIGSYFSQNSGPQDVESSGLAIYETGLTALGNAGSAAMSTLSMLGASVFAYRNQPRGIVCEEELDDWEDTAWPADPLFNHSVGYLEALQEAPLVRSIDDQLMAQIGGRYLRDSTLEGYDDVLMLQYLSQVIHVQIESLEQNPLCTDADRLELCSEIAGERLKDLAAYRDLRKALAQAIQYTKLYLYAPNPHRELKERLQAMGMGESFFFMGGYKNLGSGHAIDYEIEKTGTNRFTVRIFNRGDGLEYHARGDVRGKRKASGFVEMQNVSLLSLTSPTFVDALRELNEPSIRGEHWNGSDVFQSLFPALDGEIAPSDSGLYVPEKALEQLRVGHCTYLSLSALFHERMGEGTFQRYELLLQFKTLWDYYVQQKGALETNPVQRKLLSESAKQFAMLVGEAKELSVEERTFFKKAIKEIEEAAIFAEKNQKLEPHTPDILASRPFDETKVPEGRSSVAFEESAHLSSAASLIDVVPFDGKEPFGTYCTRWEKIFTSPTRENPVAKEAIKEWVRKIPISYLEHPERFSELDAKEGEEILVAIASIAKELVVLKMESAKVGGQQIDVLEPSDFFTLVKLLSLGDAVGKGSKVAGGDLRSLYQWPMNLLLESGSGSAMLFDPNLENQIRILKTYWDFADPQEKRKDLSFFGLEALPPHLTVGGYRDIENAPSRPDTFPWPDLLWAEQYVQDPNVQRDMQQRNSLLARQSYLFQAIDSLGRIRNHYAEGLSWTQRSLLDALKDAPRDFLPPAFYALRDLSDALDLLLHFVNDERSAEKTGEDIRDKFRSAAGILIPAAGITKERWRLFTKEWDLWDHDISEGVYAVSVRKGSELKQEGLTIEAGIDENYALQKGQDSWAAQRPILQERRKVFGSEAASDVWRRRGEGWRRQWLQLALDGNPEKAEEFLHLIGVKELQIVHTLGYFRSHLGLFQSKDVRTLFLALMAEPPLLVEELRIGGEPFAKMLAAFVRDGYQFYQDLNEPETAAYFLDLNRYFQRAAEEMLPGVEIEFLNSRQILKEVAAQGNPQERTAHLLDLTAHLEPDLLDEVGAGDLLSAYIASDLYPLRPEHPLYSVSETTVRRRQLIRFQSGLNKLLSGPGRDRILNAALQSEFPSASHTWVPDPKFPLFTTEDGAFSIDVREGKLYQKGRELIPLPQELAEHSVIKPFVHDRLIVRRIQPGLYEWSLSNGQKIQVAKTGEKVRIQRKVEPGIWAEYIKDSKKFPVPGLLIGNHLWVQESAEKRFWISRGSDGQLLYQGQGGNEPAIVSLDSERPWVLALPASQALSLLDEEGFVYIWKDPKTKKARAAEAPRLGFKLVAKEGRFTLPGYEGFFMSGVQPHPLSYHYHNSLFLNNDKGEEIVVFPNPLYISRPDEFKEPKKNAFVFDVKGNALKPREKIDSLYLACQDLWAKNYDAALKALMKYDSMLRPLTEQEAFLLSVLIDPKNGYFPDTDRSPASIAIRMKALAILAKNQLDHQGRAIGDNPTVVKERLDLFADYVQYLDKTPPSFRLTATEEKRVFQGFGGVSPLLARRATVLFKGFKNEPLLAIEQTPSDPLHDGFPDLAELVGNPEGVKAWASTVSKGFPSDGIPNGSVFRSNGLSESFRKGYALARGADRVEFAQFLTNRQVDASLSEEEVSRMIEERLSMIARSRTDFHEKLAAATLLAVFKNPDAVPDSDSMFTDGPIGACAKEGSRREERLKPFHQQMRAPTFWNQPECADLARFLRKILKEYEPPSGSSASWPASNQPWIDEEPEAAACPMEVVGQKNFADLRANPLSHVIERGEVLPAPSMDLLADVFAVSGETSPLLEQPFEEMSQKIRSWNPEKRQEIAVSSREALLEARSSLEAEVSARKEKIDRLEKRILRLANKWPSAPGDLIARQLHLLSGFEKTVTLDEMLLFFADADPALLQKRNPALSCEEANRLFRDVREFLVLSTTSQKETRVLQRISELEKLMNEQAPPQEIALKTEALDQEARAARSYEIESHPRYLVFEYRKNGLWRPAQIEALNILREAGTAKECRPGFGKTDWVAPLIALEQADGNNLSVMVVREEELPTVSLQFQEILGSAFDRKVDVLEIDRKTVLDKSALARLVWRLSEAIDERKTIVTTSSSLQSLVLRFVETLHGGDEFAALLFSRVMGLLNEKGVLTADEIDAILEILKAHHFTQGSPKSIQQDQRDAVSYFYQTVIALSEREPSIRWNFFPNQGTVPLTENSYKEFAPKLAGALLQPTESQDVDTKAFLRTRSPKEKQYLLTYLQGEEDPEAIRFIDQIPSKRVKNILSIWKEGVSQLLFLTAPKKKGEHFDLDAKGMVAPSEMGQMAKGSQHGTDPEVLFYLMQAYLPSDLPRWVIRDEIEFLKEQMVHELQRDPSKKKEETKGYLRFLELTGEEAGVSFSYVDEERIRKIEERLSSHPEWKVELIARHIFGAAKTYPEHIFTNAHIFEIVFPKKWIGFSGTVSRNFQSFPRSFQNVELSETEIETLSILWQANTPVSVIREGEGEIADLYAKTQGSFNDLGGILEERYPGTPPEKISDKIAQSIIDLPIWEGTGIKGIAFFDKENRKRMRLRGSLESIPFEESTLKKEETIAYWPQQHHTGANILLSPTMQAIVTVSRHTTMSSLVQAVWRLRDLPRGQRVHFMLLEEDAKVMAEVLKHEGCPMEDPQNPSLADLFRYVKYNAIKRQKEDNGRALPVKLKNVLLKRVWDSLSHLSKGATIERALTDPFFFEGRPEDAYDLYGKVRKAVPAEQAARQEVEKLKENAFFQRLSQEKQEEVLAVWKEIIEEALPYLPPEMVPGAGYETQIEIHTQAETEVETKTQLEVETQVQQQQEIVHEADEDIHERFVFLWKEEGLFQERYFAPEESKQDPDPKQFLEGALALPDSERKKMPAYPMDHLDVEGEDLLAKEGIRPLSRMDPLASPEFLTSWNRLPNQKSDVVLVIQTKATKKISVVALSEWDTLMFRRLLAKDREGSGTKEREVDLALYHLDLGIIDQGREKIAKEALEGSSAFSRLKVEMKFFNGKTHYTKEEIPILEAWVRRVSKEALKQLFHKIVEDKPASSDLYKDSSLSLVLD